MKSQFSRVYYIKVINGHCHINSAEIKLEGSSSDLVILFSLPLFYNILKCLRDFAEIFLSEIIVLLAKVKGMDKRIAAAPGSKHYWDTKR